MIEQIAIFLVVYFVISLVLFTITGIIYAFIHHSITGKKLIPPEKIVAEGMGFIFLTSLLNTGTIFIMIFSLLTTLAEKNITSIFFIPPHIFLISFILALVFWISLTLVGLHVILINKKKG